MNQDDAEARGSWECDWESHRRRQLALGLSATPAERYAWLVAMIELAWRTGALPRPRPEDASRDES